MGRTDSSRNGRGDDGRRNTHRAEGSRNRNDRSRSRPASRRHDHARAMAMPPGTSRIQHALVELPGLPRYDRRACDRSGHVRHRARHADDVANRHQRHQKLHRKTTVVAVTIAVPGTPAVPIDDSSPITASAT